MPGIGSLADCKLPGIAIISGDCHAALAVLRTVIAGDSALLLAGVNLRSLNSGDCHAALAVLRTVIAGDSALLLAGVNLRSLNSGDCHAALAVLRTVIAGDYRGVISGDCLAVRKTILVPGAIQVY